MRNCSCAAMSILKSHWLSSMENIKKQCNIMFVIFTHQPWIYWLFNNSSFFKLLHESQHACKCKHYVKWQLTNWFTSYNHHHLFIYIFHSNGTKIMLHSQSCNCCSEFIASSSWHFAMFILIKQRILKKYVPGQFL